MRIEHEVFARVRSLCTRQIDSSRERSCRAIPSSCRLSMSACFCASVIVIALRFAGLRSGVCVSSSPVFVGSMADGAGKDGMSSLDEVDALADAICFCFRGGISFEVCRCRGCFTERFEGAVMSYLRRASYGAIVCKLIYRDGLGSGPKQTAKSSSPSGVTDFDPRKQPLEAPAALSRNSTTTELSIDNPSYLTRTPTSASPLDYLTISATAYHRISPARAQSPKHSHLSQHRQDGSRGDYDCVCTCV